MRGVRLAGAKYPATPATLCIMITALAAANFIGIDSSRRYGFLRADGRIMWTIDATVNQQHDSFADSLEAIRVLIDTVCTSTTEQPSDCIARPLEIFTHTDDDTGYTSQVLGRCGLGGAAHLHRHHGELGPVGDVQPRARPPQRRHLRAPPTVTRGRYAAFTRPLRLPRRCVPPAPAPPALPPRSRRRGRRGGGHRGRAPSNSEPPSARREQCDA